MKRLLFAIITALTVSHGFAEELTIYVPGSYKAFQLVDDNCPVQPKDRSVVWHLFRYQGADEGCWIISKKNKGIYLIQFGSKSISGQPVDVFFTYEQLKQSQDEYESMI